MFGIRLGKGSLSDASLSDKLMALGSALDDDMDAVAAIRDRREREKLASLLARELEAGRTLPEQAPPQPVMQQPAPRVDPMAQAAGDVVGRIQAAHGLDAPKLGGVRPDPVSVNLPRMDQPQRGLYDRMLPMLIQAAGKGIDINGLAGLIRNEDYVRNLPQKDQSAARLDPSRYAGWQREDSRPIIGERSPGSVLTSTNPVTGDTREVYNAPFRPEPVTTDRVIGAVLAKKQRGEALTGDEQAIFERWQAGSDGFYRERPPQRERTMTPRQTIEQKVMNGQPLTAGEQRLWEVMQRNPLAGLFESGGGDQQDEVPQTPQKNTPPQRPASPAPGLPQKKASPAQPPTAKVGTSLNPARPRSRAEAAALPPGTWFRDPAGNLIQKR